MCTVFTRRLDCSRHIWHGGLKGPLLFWGGLLITWSVYSFRCHSAVRGTQNGSSLFGLPGVLALLQKNTSSGVEIRKEEVTPMVF